MRDPNRIPIILSKLEQIWKENPDMRLGQLIVNAARPETANSSIFHIEDEEMLQGISAIGSKETSSNESKDGIPYWERYPDVSKLAVEDLSIELVEKMLAIIQSENGKYIITATKLMELNGAPVDDYSWLSKQNARIEKLQNLLKEIAIKNGIEEVQIGYRIKE